MQCVSMLRIIMQINISLSVIMTSVNLPNAFMLSAIMLNVMLFSTSDCHYAKCHYAYYYFGDCRCTDQGIQKGKYHCTVDLLFD